MQALEWSNSESALVQFRHPIGPVQTFDWSSSDAGLVLFRLQSGPVQTLVNPVQTLVRSCSDTESVQSWAVPVQIQGWSNADTGQV